MPDSSPIWSSLNPDEHEFQYNPQKAFPDFDQARRNRDPANAAAQALDCHRDIAYGPHALHTLDIYPARGSERAPVHVFFHGGYWRAQDKMNFAYVAGALVPLGVTTVIANYELCPAATLDAVAESALAAIAFIARNIADFGGDPAAITVSGHSAGGHLGAECLACDWSARGLPKDLVRGATLISGIFDPAPARLTTVNAQLNLTDEIIGRRNVEARMPLNACPVTLVVGGREPWHWIDQSYRYAHHLHRHGYAYGMHVVPGRGHFDIIDEYLDPESATMRAIRAHVAGRAA